MASDEQMPNKVICNSLYKDSQESNDDFTILLPASLKNIKQIKFGSVVFPNSMRPFKGSEFGSNQNNTYVVIDDTGGTPNSQTFTIDSSLVFPTGDDFADYIEDQLNTQFGAGLYNVSLNPLGDFLVITRTGGATFTLDTDSSSFTAQRKMGFVGGTTDYTDQTTITAEDPLYLARTSIVYIHSNICDGDCITDQAQNRKDVGLIIPVNTNYGFIQTFQASDDRVIRENLNAISRISFTLRDEEGDLIGLSERSYVHLELDIDYMDLREVERRPGGIAPGQRFQ